MIFEIKDLHFTYFLGKEKIEALRGLTFSIKKGVMTAISGPSGSGKSTLLNILGLIEPAGPGQVFLSGRDLATLAEREKNQIRKHRFGFIFQQFHLIPVLTAEENVAYFLSAQGLSQDEIRTRTDEALEAVGLSLQRKQKPFELSGGQKQRIAIARAIAKRPDLIIADEPTASLDRKTARGIMELLAACSRTVILTTHDPMVEAYAQDKIHLIDGKLA